MLNNYPIIKKGEKPGKTSVILAGVHGNEPCGFLAFDEILPSLNIESGTVIFQLGNLEAIKQKVRFVEMNLNRAFKPESEHTLDEKNTYEYKRAQELKTFFDQADALLDIHSSKNIDSRQFIICEPNSFLISQYLPFNLVVSGFDEHEPGGTDGYMNSKNKVGICIECGQHDDSLAVVKAKESIISFLIAMGHISNKDSNENKTQEQEKITITFLYKNKDQNFKLEKVFKDFEDIERGTLIGYDGVDQILAPYKSKIIFAHDVAGKIGQECFLLAEIA